MVGSVGAFASRGERASREAHAARSDVVQLASLLRDHEDARFGEQRERKVGSTVGEFPS
jgi:hypothetical protein